MCSPPKPAIKHINANVGSWVSGSTCWSGSDISCSCRRSDSSTHCILFVLREMALRAVTQRSVQGYSSPNIRWTPPPRHPGRAGQCYGQRDALKAVTYAQRDLNSHQLKEWEGVSGGPVSSDVLSRVSVTARLDCCLLGVISHILVWLLGWRPSLVLSTFPQATTGLPLHALQTVRTATCIYVPSWRSLLNWKPCLAAGTNNGKLDVNQSEESATVIIFVK